jgi:ATP-dependent DNA helicase RecG
VIARVRPEILFPLFAPITALTGVGPRLRPLLEKLAGPAIVDVLWHLPTALIDRRFRPKIREAPAGSVATLTVRVDGHLPGHGKRPYRVRCLDETGFLHLVYFHAKGDFLARLLPVGTTRIVSGRIEHFNNEVQITHPDHVVAPEEEGQLKPIEPVYGLTAGLTPRVVQKAVAAALDRAPELPEWIDPAFQRRQEIGRAHV